MRFCHNRKCVSYKSGLSVVKYYRRTGDKVTTKEKLFDGRQQEKMVMDQPWNSCRNLGFRVHRNRFVFYESFSSKYKG